MNLRKAFETIISLLHTIAMHTKPKLKIKPKSNYKGRPFGAKDLKPRKRTKK